MSHVKHVLTNATYLKIADSGDTVNVQLPVPPYRQGRADQVELLTATSLPSAPSNPDTPDEKATILENTRYGFNTVTQLTLSTSPADNLYARWLGTYPYTDANDRYVVTF